TFPFITAGIEQVSNLFDENLSFHRDMLDNKIHSNDVECAKSLNHWKHGEKYVHDEFTYEKLYNKMISMTEPYFLITHTGSSHYNYPIKDGFKPKDKISKEERYYYSLKYADQTLRKFFDRIKKHPTYKNTIFILISDHTAGRNHYSLYDKYHIPALVYAPGIISAGEINKPTFQCDIGPTILDILNIDGNYTTFGTSAFQKNLPQRGMILPDWDGYLVFVYDPYIAKVDVNKVYEIYNFRQNKERNQINNPDMINKIKDIHQEFLKTYQFFADNIYGNKLLPLAK
ncbi:MAG: LTA synthase family protein, partial [Janthinobacterium lividum]